MHLIIGLGNPGKEYEHTRHNIGFRVVDALAKKIGLGEWKNVEKYQVLMIEANEANEAINYKLIKPLTFMNLSGKSVSALVNFYKLDPKKDLLVISDDKDLVFGKIRERASGTSGGHKGLQSIIDHLGTNAFHHIKMGVGHPNQRIPTDAFVLQKFTAEEEKALPEIIEEAVKKAKAWMAS